MLRVTAPDFVKVMPREITVKSKPGQKDRFIVTTTVEASEVFDMVKETMRKEFGVDTGSASQVSQLKVSGQTSAITIDLETDEATTKRLLGVE